MKSNKLSLVMAASVLFAGASSGALADDKWLGDRGSNWEEHIQSTKTRAEVIAELNEARAQGLLRVGDDPFYPRQPMSTTSRSRAEVRAEAADFARRGNSSANSYYSSGQ